jgi:hypothetical protein
MKTERAQLVRAVNKSQIEKHDKGWTIRDVVPVIDNIVMNNGLYPADELAQSYESLSGVPAPIGHPQDEQGNYISAMRGDALRNYYAGVTVENARKEGERYLVDLEINEAQAAAHPDGQRMIEAINSGESVHVSTGLMLQREPEEGISRGKRYGWRATNIQFDHLAILLDEKGAATPEQGVGILANCAELYVNLDKYEADEVVSKREKLSYEDITKKARLELSDKLQLTEDEAIWIEETYSDEIIFLRAKKHEEPQYYIVSYTIEDDDVVIADDFRLAKKNVSYAAAINQAIRRALSIFAPGMAGGYNQHHAQSMPTSEDSGESEMNEEQVKALIADAVQGLATNADMDDKDKKIAKLEDELNAMKKKYEANEASEKATLVEQINSATGATKESLESMEVNALRTWAETLKPGTATAVNAGQPATDTQVNFELVD